MEDWNRGNGRINEGNLFANGEGLCFDSLGVGERDLAEPELDGRYIPPVRRRKEGKKVNEGNVAVLEGTAGEASITATAGSPAGEGRGGGCAQRRRESR